MVTHTQLPPNFDINKAIELAELSDLAYAQYKAFSEKQSWTLPAPYSLEIVLDAVYENDNTPLGFIAKANNNLYIVWRGTQDIEEWIEDAKYEQTQCSFLNKGEKIALGFDEMYTSGDSKTDSPQKKVLNYLKQVKVGSYTDLWITGHSLGGALAVLNICDIVNNTEHKQAKMYSFAGPRVGDGNFANTFNKSVSLSWRVINSHDAVPNLPPEYCPPILHTYHYEHVNQAFPISFGNSWDLVKDHSIQGYIDTLNLLT